MSLKKEFFVLLKDNIYISDQVGIYIKQKKYCSVVGHYIIFKHYSTDITQWLLIISRDYSTITYWSCCFLTQSDLM